MAQDHDKTFEIKKIYPSTKKVKVMNYWEYAEKLNGRLAMLGIIAAIGAYATTGQIIPGVF